MAKAATNRAYSPADNQYPKMLYKGAETSVVATAEEEADKIKAGWALTRPANVKPVHPTRHGSSNPAPQVPSKELADLSALVGKLSATVSGMTETIAVLTETATSQEARLVALEQAATDAEPKGDGAKSKAK